MEELLLGDCWSLSSTKVSFSITPGPVPVSVYTQPFFRASPAVLNILIPQRKIGWRKEKTFPFGSGKWSWLSIIEHFAVVGERFSWRECNKYDLTAAQYFWLANHNDWSRWFAISTPQPICCPSFSFTIKKVITKLGCEKHFCSVIYYLEMLPSILCQCFLFFLYHFFLLQYRLNQGFGFSNFWTSRWTSSDHPQEEWAKFALRSSASKVEFF